MNTIRRIAKNTGLMLISQIITYGLAFIFMIYSARYLGVENFGILSFALAFSGIMVIFADLGLTTLMVREISRDRSLMEKYVKNIGFMKHILSLITLIFSILILLIIGYNEKNNILIVTLVIIYSLFGSLSLIFYSLFQAHENMGYQSLGQIINSLLLLLGAIYLINNQIDIFGFALLYFFAGLVVYLYSLFICGWKFVPPKFEIDFGFWKKLIKKALPLSLIVIFSVVTFRIDMVLLSILDGNIAVGLYSAPYRLMEVLIFIPAVYTASIYPVFSRYHVSSRESLKIAYEKSFKYLSILSIPIAVGITLLADKIILIIYGVGFSDSIIALKILIWTIPLIFLSNVFGTLMISINKQDIGLKIIFSCMVLNIILNLIFIPSFSYIAASIITVITELTALILAVYFLSKYVSKIQIPRLIIKPIIASLVMGLFIIFKINMDFILLVLSSSIIYFAAFILLKGFSKEDFDLFRRILNR